MAGRPLPDSSATGERNRRFSLLRWELSILVVGLAVATLPNVMPAMVGALANQFHLAIKDAGYAASANMGGIFLGALIFAGLGRYFPLRRLLTGGLIVMVAGNLVTIVSSGYGALMASRIFSGLGEGVAGGACYLLMAASVQPARMLALYLAGQAIVGAVGLAVLPSLSERFGWRWFFIVVSLVALPAIGLAAVTAWPKPEKEAILDADPKSSREGSRGRLTLGAIFLYFVGMSAVWAMMERLGAEHGLSLLGVSAAMSTSSVLGLVGALTASAAGRRLPDNFAMITCALLALIGPALLFPSSQGAFFIGASVQSFTWSFTFPFLFRLLAEVSSGSRIVGLTPAATGAALAVGPAVGGAVLQSFGKDALYGLCMALTVGGVALARLSRSGPKPPSTVSASGAPDVLDSPCA